MSNSGKKSNFFQFFITFLLLFFVFQFVMERFFPEQFSKDGEVVAEVTLKAQDATVKGGHHPILLLANKTDQKIVLEDRCPMPPVNVLHSVDGEFVALETEETSVPCVPLTEIAAGKTEKIDLAAWKYSLFGELGNYRVELLTADSSQQALTADLSIHEAGPITRIFRTFVSKPLLNLLIFIASILPGHNLGLAIILLTLIVKVILFFPTQHAMQGQKKLQKVQPQLAEIRKKHKANPEKMNKEIMALWKREKVNPMQSCLPTLIQFPILIGLFYVIRDGSILSLSEHLIYSPFKDLDWVWGSNFLGMNLLEPNKIFFPPFLVLAQFFQMKMAFAIAKKKKDPKKKAEAADQQEMQQKMMQYGLPLMIGVFAFQFPAAVSLYWAVSTLFAIGQQYVVNKRN